jgi:hypothetical protein
MNKYIIIFFLLVFANNFFAQNYKYVFKSNFFKFGIKKIHVEHVNDRDVVVVAIIFDSNFRNNKCLNSKFSLRKKRDFVNWEDGGEGTQIYYFNRNDFYRTRKLYLKITDTCTNESHIYVLKRKKIKRKKGGLVPGH